MAQSVSFVPTMISSCILWFDAADSTTITTSAGAGSQVLRWANKGTLSNLFASNVQATGTIDPSYTSWPPPGTTTWGTNKFTTSPLSTVSFTSTNGSGGSLGGGFNGSYLTIQNMVNTSKSRTVFFVWGPRSAYPGGNQYTRVFGSTSIYPTTGTNSNWFNYMDIGFAQMNMFPASYGGEALAMGYGPSNGGAVSLQLFPPGNTNVFALRHTTSYLSNYGSVNGVKANPTANNPLVFGYRTGTDEMFLGVGAYYNFPFFMGEFVYFDSALSDQDVKRMEAYLCYKWGVNTNLPSTLFSSAPPPSFNPASISGRTLRLWYDANDSSTIFSDTAATTLAVQNGTVARWNDKSGNGNYLLQNTAGNRPTFSTFSNAYRSVFFNTDSIQLATLNNNPQSGNLSRAVYAVCFLPGSGSICRIQTGTMTGASPPIAFGIDNNKDPNGNIVYIPYVFSGADNVVYNNMYFTQLNYAYYDSTRSVIGGSLNAGGERSTSTTLNTTANVWTFGTRTGGAGCVNAHICEFLLYDAPLSPLQHQQVQSYLMFKWGIQSISPVYSIPFTSYYLAPPTGSNILQLIQFNLLNTLGSGGTLTLPSSFALQGRPLIFKDQYGSFLSNTLTLTTNNANQRIDSNSGFSTINTTNYGWQTVIAGSDNNWYTVGGTVLNQINTSTLNAVGVSSSRISSGNLQLSTLTLLDQIGNSTTTLYANSSFLFYLFNNQSTIISGTRQSFGGLFTPLKAPFLPNQIAALQFWVDAADQNTVQLSNSLVSQWNDKSGNNRNLGGLVGVIQYGLFQNRRCIQQQVGSSLVVVSTVDLTNFSFFIVNCSPSTAGNQTVFAGMAAAGQANWNSTVGFGFYIDGNVNPSQTRFYGTTTVGQNAIQTVASTNIPYPFTLFFGSFSSTGAITTFINGNTGATGTAGARSSGATGFALAETTGSSVTARNSGAFISEVLVYNTVLIPAQRQQVEGYLAWKWGLVGSLPPSHPFKNSPP